LTNLAIANNTVSIVITGTIAKEINDEYDLSQENSSDTDIFSCGTGIYLTAQVLLILSFAR
jgi:Na+/H+ antiporter NhaC